MNKVYDLDENSKEFSTINFDEELEVRAVEKNELLKDFSSMLTIRVVEQKLAQMRKNGLIGGPVHLSAGQEAIAVGISRFLRKSDRIFSGHRSHAHLLALGGDPRKLFAEVLGRNTGFTKGAGGSMHLWDADNGFLGSVPVVAGTVSLAVGAALASRLQGKSDIAVAYFGDGAMEEGVVHESMNLARQLNAPVLFVCENNLFSSHMHISQRQPLNSVVRFAEANDIYSKIIDGNNIIKVKQVAEKMIGIARDTYSPVFIEAITYRHYGHVDWREDLDVGVNRSKKDLNLWKSRDPIERLKYSLISLNIFHASELENVRIEIEQQINQAWDMANDDPKADVNSLNEDVLKR